MYYSKVLANLLCLVPWSHCIPPSISQLPANSSINITAGSLLCKNIHSEPQQTTTVKSRGVHALYFLDNLSQDS